MNCPSICVVLETPFFRREEPYTATILMRETPRVGDFIQCGDVLLKVETVVWPFARKGTDDTSPTIWVAPLPDVPEYRDTLLKAGFRPAPGMERP